MTIAPILTTARLTLRPWSDHDLVMLAELGADPAVVRWVGDGQPWTRERAGQSHERALAHWARHGFGWRVAVARDGGETVGFISLNFAAAGSPELSEGDYEIGWWIAPAAWQRGYAREGAAAVRDEAFARLGAPAIVARLRPANHGSRGVAESIGMRLQRELIDGLGLPVAVYGLARDEARDGAPGTAPERGDPSGG